MSIPINWNNKYEENVCEPEADSNMLEETADGKINMKQLYAAHMLGMDYGFHDSDVDYKGKPRTFLQHVTPHQKKKWLKEIMEEAKAAPQEGASEWCYLLYHGPDRGLYLNFKQFKEKRDEPYTIRTNGYSWKAARFKSVHDARRYCQAVRDEEGAHWQWPGQLSIFWSRPRLTA